ncbi:MAG TPA: hypothetical protein VFH90_06365 [Candidatus Limnocylindria bacterium]|nr:hypothetical protein [Candidatus Limnocylindria bacterium]
MTLRANAPRAKRRWTALLAAVSLLIGLTTTTVLAAPPGISLEQCRNGSAASPNDCEDLGGSAGWVNGNVGASQGHLLEGYSIPYRALMNNLPANTNITVTLGYDITHSGAHAIDYLTHYDRLEPHGFFGHGDAEDVFPVSGTSVSATPFATLAIPEPSNLSADASAGWANIPAEQKVITLFGGTFPASQPTFYVTEGDINASQSEARVQFTFLTDSDGGSAVLAWGGHIARGDHWDGDSASAISGSPYHMRLKAWTLGNVGNQDRSLSAGAVQVETSTTTTQPSAQLTFSVALNDRADVSAGGGTVEFNLWSTKSADTPPVCSGLLYTETVALSGGSATTTGTGSFGSNVVAPTSATTYYWTADYSGDDTTEPSSSPCGAESVTVTPPTIGLVPAPAP